VSRRDRRRLPPLRAVVGIDGVGEDGVDDVGVVVDAELVGHGEQQRVGGCGRLVFLELLDQYIGLGGVAATEDSLGPGVDESGLVSVLATPK